MLRQGWIVLMVAPGLLVWNLGCGPSCPEGWSPTESGECISDTSDDDDDTGDDDTGDDDTSGTDEDGDGWTVEDGDCDDNDIEVNPGETEVPCDGKDNDCNSETLDEPTDGDGDGVLVCDTPGDCDDTDPLVNPAAPEVLGNATDDDCDGGSDEVQVLYLIKGSDAFDADVMGTRLAAETGGDIEIKGTVDIEVAAEMDAVAKDLVHYHVALVEYRTRTGGNWGGDHTYLTTWGLPILGLGNGGGALLQALGANLNFSAPASPDSDALSVIVTTHAFFDGVTFAKDLATITSSDEPVFGLPTTPGEPLGYHEDDPNTALLTHDTAMPDAWIFGFNATGDAFTSDGITIIANILADIAG